MRKNRIKGYWILLMSLLLVATAVLSVGTTQARQENTVTSVAVLATPVKEITSNCLIIEADAPRTVLLGETNLENLSSVEVPFWLLSSGADATLPLNWYISDQAQAEYFHVVLKLKESSANSSTEISEESWKVLEQGVEIELFKDTRQDLVLCVEPTENARSTAHEKMTVNVCVTAGDIMKGTFQIILPEVEPEEPAEPEEPTGSETPSEPETPTEPEEPTDPDTSTDTENPTVSGNSVEPIAQKHPTVSSNSLEPVAQEESTDLNETTESKESTVEKSSAKLKTLPAFDITQQLPVVLTLEEPATSVRLGVQKEKDESVTFEALPDYTMFSVDGGATYFMVYGDYIPELVPDSATMPLLLDFRYTDLTQEEKLTLGMEVFLEGQFQSTVTAVTTAAVNRDWQSGPILNFEKTLEFAFPEEWKDAELTYSVEYLTMTEEHTLQYIPVELSEDGLQASYEKQENNYRLVLELGEKFTSPGTYRLRISWSYEGLCYDTAQTNFFVNCSGWVAPDASGSEVSDDE